MLKIILQRPNNNVPGTFKELYRISIDVDDYDYIPFNSLVKHFKFLYPFNDLIINFEVF